MDTVNLLPSDLRSWDEERIKEARDERELRMKTLCAQPLDQMGRDEAGEMKRLNDELAALNEWSPLQPMIHPKQPGSSIGGRSYKAADFGRVDGLGAEFLNQLGRGPGGLKSALDGTTGGGSLPGAFYNPRLRELPQRRLFVRSMLPTTRITTNVVQYVRQTVFTNNAAAVAVGAVKPTTVVTAEQVSAPVRVIAHISEALDRSILSDYDQLTSFIDNQLRLGVLLEEEDQIINGNGTTPNISGILDQSDLQTQAKGADPTPDAIHKAITKIRLNAFLEPDAVVLHPNDWQQIALLTNADGVYLFGSPHDDVAPKIWGKPVITSPVIAEGTGLAGAFGVGAEVYEREGARVSFAETGLSDVAGEELFSKNEVRFRGESRLALAVYRGNAFCSISGI